MNNYQKGKKIKYNHLKLKSWNIKMILQKLKMLLKN